jgi:hypothetical protein
VLTGLIARGGYWSGDETTDVGYNTHENADLVALDREIIDASGVDWTRLPPRPIDETTIAGLHKAIDVLDKDRSLAFVERCQAHRPWIWKDPRLAYTIHYWESFLDLSECQFIIMGRDFRQAWSAHMIKGNRAVRYRVFHAVRHGLLESARRYAREHRLQSMSTTFEELTVEPQKVIDKLNGFLGTALTMDDFHATYSGPVGKLRWSKLDYLHAWARYQAHRWILRDVPGRSSGKRRQ